MTNVYVLDDHKVFIEGILMMLKKIEWLDKVEGYTEVQDFYREVVDKERKKNGILILDVNLNRVLNGIDICKEIKKKAPDMKVIVLTLHHEKRFVHGMVKAGCDAYLLKSNSFNEIKTAITEVSKGRKYFANDVKQSLSKENKLNDVILNLNPREKRVLEAVLKGMMNSEIAETLKVSIKTVEYYRKGLYIKFGVSNAVELANEVNKNELFV